MPDPFKVMFIFFNDRMRTIIPPNISYLSASLKDAGFQTCMFDTSFYAEHERLMEEKKKEDAGIFKPTDYSSIGVEIKKGSMVDDMLSMIDAEKPGLIAFSVFSQSKTANFRLAEAIKKRFSDIPIIFGGIHVNIEPRDVLGRDYIDYVCLGEGEEALVELASNLMGGKGAEGVRNIGWKKDGEIIMNPCRPPQDLDKLPFPDWDLFKPYHLYGPYRGKMLRMALVDFSRTCPYNCAYCGNRTLKDVYSKSGHIVKYRHKSPQHWVSELKHMKEKYSIEFVNIIDGTFVAQREAVLEELAPLYAKEIGLPFFCDATVHCLTPRKAELLKQMGCVCINMGVECGDEEYRKKYMDRTMTNEKIINAFLMARDAGLDTRSYNIIGLPFETRENIMETVELNRKCKVGSVSMSIFMPYEGTKLRELCIKENLISPDQEIVGDGTYPIIKNPNLPDEELMKIYNTFALYVLAPRDLFHVIKLAEPDTPFARQLRKELLAIYT
jgi:radical SAM superfamily enzyme YgiQ (UPF0313 family)